MPRIGQKWRPALWMVLGGALAGTLALSYAGLVLLRYIGPQIGFRNAALLLATAIAALTGLVGWLLARLLLRPITALAAHAAALRQGAPAGPLRHYGTRELRDLGQSVIDMATTLQNREATIRSFTDHVTHELKTPVSAIRAAAELLEDGTLAPDDRRLTAQILGAAQQMQDQLDALRQIAAAREPSHHGATRLADVAAGLRAAHPSLDLELTADETPIPLSREGLVLVLGHLLRNAVEHGAACVRLSAEASAEHATLTVSDNGLGISEGNRSRIFEPFFTTRREKGGTGMGLAIVASLLRAHGGDISLVTTGPGAAFRMTFAGSR